jgi:hypothetical protein
MADDNAGMLNAMETAIAKDAPGLAALLAGPNAAMATSALGKALLGDSQASLAEVAAAVQQGDKLKIAAAEQEVQLRLRQASGGSLADLPAALPGRGVATPADGADTDRAERDKDTDSARQMQIKTHDRTNKYLAYIVTAGFFGLITFLMYTVEHPIAQIDGGLKDLMFTLLGVVATGWANIIGFYFGSSAGSAQKSQTIAAALLPGGPAGRSSGR